MLPIAASALALSLSLSLQGRGARFSFLLSLRRDRKKPSSHPRTYPTDSASGFVDSSDTKTWQANLWSAGCLVMNPKYLRVNRASETGLADR